MVLCVSQDLCNKTQTSHKALFWFLCHVHHKALIYAIKLLNYSEHRLDAMPSSAQSMNLVWDKILTSSLTPVKI